ncbi:MAG: phosphomannomutase/phosphoglucomutase [Gemmatimonadetes bacterium]|nr:phosphomannomutase/phosphoglucomutase [Gemmatimonadota bacterium]
MALATHIFREYDIRGIVDRDLDQEVTRLVGRAYGSVLEETQGGGPARVAVGQDNRPHSPRLAEGLMDGLMSAGVDVVSLGTVPTPLALWAEHRLKTDGAIQITGSHNPPDYNGIKMTLQQKSFFGAAIQDLLDRIQTGRLSDGSGSLVHQDVIPDYIAEVAKGFQLARPVRVVVDCGNGAGALVATDLLSAIGADVIPLYCESDGTFPNHHPDPTVDEYLVDMIELVREREADLGIAFDGDADRIGAVDENGTVVRGDILLLLFGLDILDQLGPGQKLVFDVKCSQVLPEAFAKAGGDPVMWRTGHSHIKARMKELGAPLGGELSGHICFADNYIGIDDAPYAACRLVDLLARKDRPLSDLVADLPQYVATPEIRIEVDEEKKWEVVERALEHFRKSHDVIDVDGARVLFGDGWGLLRTSNTQPVIVARFEARTPERLAEIQGLMENWLATQGIHV